MTDEGRKNKVSGSAPRLETTAEKTDAGQPTIGNKERSAFARRDRSRGNAPRPETEPREGDDERLDEALKESFPASDPLPINPGPERTG